MQMVVISQIMLIISCIALVYKYQDYFMEKISELEWGSNPHTHTSAIALMSWA